MTLSFRMISLWNFDDGPGSRYYTSISHLPVILHGHLLSAGVFWDS